MIVVRRAFAVLAALATVTQPVRSAPAPAEPAFYRWATAIRTPPGSVLRREPLERALVPPSTGVAERILYASTSGWGKPRRIATSGEVLLPRGTPPAGGWPVIAWAHGTTGVADACAPSRRAPSSEDAAALGHWLDQGYAIVATDYEGLGTAGPHPYFGVKAAAYSVLDSVRAARRAFPMLSPRTIIVGHSQGAHAALSAGLIAPKYAPELDIRGIVATGVPGERGFEAAADALPSQIARAPLPEPAAPRGLVRGVAMDRFDGWTIVMMHYFASYAAVERGFRARDWLTPRGLALRDEMARTCRGPVQTALFADKPPSSAIFAQDPALLEARHTNARRYPDPAFRMPVFFGIGLADAFTAPELAFNVARSACIRGSAVTVRFYPGIGHSGSMRAAESDASSFARKAFDGSAAPQDCPGLRWNGRR